MLVDCLPGTIEAHCIITCRTGLLSLVALTLHFSVLSLTLHVARQQTPRFHASSAIFLTELLKIMVAISLTLCTGELRPRIMEQKRTRAELEERLALAEANEPIWIAERQQEKEGTDQANGHHDWLQGAGEASAPCESEQTVVRYVETRRN